MAGLLSDVGGGLGNMFDGSNPSLKVVPLDPGTQKLIGDTTARAGQSNAELTKQANEGVAASGAQATQSDQSLKQDAAASGQNPAMLQAIKNQYGQVAGKSIQDTVTRNQNNASMRRAQMLSEAAKAQLAKQQVETQNYEALSNAMNQAEMARAQVLSSIFGAVGTAAGMYVAGRGRRGRSHNSPQRESFGDGMTAVNDMGG